MKNNSKVINFSLLLGETSHHMKFCRRNANIFTATGHYFLRVCRMTNFIYIFREIFITPNFHQVEEMRNNKINNTLFHPDGISLQFLSTSYDLNSLASNHIFKDPVKSGHKRINLVGDLQFHSYTSTQNCQRYSQLETNHQINEAAIKFKHPHSFIRTRKQNNFPKYFISVSRKTFIERITKQESSAHVCSTFRRIHWRLRNTTDWDNYFNKGNNCR